MLLVQGDERYLNDVLVVIIVKVLTVTSEAGEGGVWLHVTPEGEGVVVVARSMEMRQS